MAGRTFTPTSGGLSDGEHRHLADAHRSRKAVGPRATHYSLRLLPESAQDLAQPFDLGAVAGPVPTALGLDGGLVGLTRLTRQHCTVRGERDRRNGWL